MSLSNSYYFFSPRTLSLNLSLSRGPSTILHGERTPGVEKPMIHTELLRYIAPYYLATKQQQPTNRSK